jgi:hypothetical protein
MHVDDQEPAGLPDPGYSRPRDVIALTWEAFAAHTAAQLDDGGDEITDCEALRHSCLAERARRLTAEVKLRSHEDPRLARFRDTPLAEDPAVMVPFRRRDLGELTQSLTLDQALDAVWMAVNAALVLDA